jgi:hypothetical protein
MKANRVTSKRIFDFYCQKFDAIYARINEMTTLQVDDALYEIHQSLSYDLRRHNNQLGDLYEVQN